MLFFGSVNTAALDLSKVQCDLPWEVFSTESNTTGIHFEEQRMSGNPYFLWMTNVEPGNFTAEMKFSMRTLLSSDMVSSVGIQIWEGLETFGKDKSRKGHFLILFNSNGHLEVKRWNGSYYTTLTYMNRFSLGADKPQVLKVEAIKAGSIKVYLNDKIQMTVRVKPKVNINTPVKLCAFPGTWMEMTSFTVK
jgi:hypothetical protein